MTSAAVRPELAASAPEGAHFIRPWYRHPWPWILMAGPAIVVVAGIVTTWLAVTTFDGLVAEDYYKRGLAVNQDLARHERARALGLSARVHYLRSSGAVEVRLHSAIPVDRPGELTIHFSHATRGGHDRTLRLTRNADGRYLGRLDALPAGDWHASLEDETRTWRIGARSRGADWMEMELTPLAALKAYKKAAAPDATEEPWKERMFAVLWPAFLAAGFLEMLVFALIDPEDVVIAGQHVTGSNLAVYTLAFLLFWAVTCASSAMTCLLGVHGAERPVAPNKETAQ